jgi:hypothetical protein
MESLGFALISLVSFGIGIFPSDESTVPLVLRIAFLVGGLLTGIAVVAH